MTVLEPVAARPSAGRRWWLPLVPNLVWEMLLATALVVVVLTATVGTHHLFDYGLPWGQFATVGLAASGVALSLRTRTPNLAVSALAGFAGYVFADLVSSGQAVASAVLIAVASCLLIGVVLGVVLGLTDLPAWALTVGVATLLEAIYLSGYGGGRAIPIDPDVRLADSDLRIWTVAFAVLSLGGAVVLALPTVRQALGMTQVAADGPRFDAGRLVGAMVGLGGSSMLAGLAGVLYVRWVGVADSGVASNLLLPALGAALLGGVSVYGSRGGFAGVILAVGLVVALNKWMPFGDGSFAVHLGLYAVVILVGLQVSWGIGMIARAIDAQREVPPTVSARTVAPTVAAPTVESSAGV